MRNIKIFVNRVDFTNTSTTNTYEQEVNNFLEKLPEDSHIKISYQVGENKLYTIVEYNKIINNTTTTTTTIINPKLDALRNFCHARNTCQGTIGVSEFECPLYDWCETSPYDLAMDDIPNEEVDKVYSLIENRNPDGTRKKYKTRDKSEAF